MVNIDYYKGYCNERVKSIRKCTCYTGWNGTYCTNAICDQYNFCNGRGKCSVLKNKHKCECKAGWKGDRCQNATCDNINNCGQNGIKNV